MSANRAAHTGPVLCGVSELPCPVFSFLRVRIFNDGLGWVGGADSNDAVLAGLGCVEVLVTPTTDVGKVLSYGMARSANSARRVV